MKKISTGAQFPRGKYKQQDSSFILRFSPCGVFIPLKDFQSHMVLSTGNTFEKCSDHRTRGLGARLWSQIIIFAHLLFFALFSEPQYILARNLGPPCHTLIWFGNQINLCVNCCYSPFSSLPANTSCGLPLKCFGRHPFIPVVHIW